MDNVNHRYKNFKHTLFTAGDIDQFESKRIRTNGKEGKEEKEEILSDNVFNKYTIFPNWEKYQQLEYDCVDNTFNYMYHKFKKVYMLKYVMVNCKHFYHFQKLIM